MSGVRRWWREDRPVFWIRNGWEWGWLGNGWNRLALGKVSIYFKSGPSPVMRARKGWHWPQEPTKPKGPE